MLVLKKNADIFDVLTDTGIKQCVARKVLKKDGLFVGDYVKIEDNVICEIEKRKNLLIRPPIANLDCMIIVIACVPKPDFLLVDKLIIFCVVHGIKPVLCINKSELDYDFIRKTLSIYENIVETVVVSASKGEVEPILNSIHGITALAGQSAVGKSSIINSILHNSVAEVGDFSKKIERGKQTTRIVQLYQLGNNKFLADTAGFSKLESYLLNLNCEELKRYYPEFLKFAHMCKYTSCAHIAGKECGVIKAVKAGEINKIRYESYLKLYENLKQLKKF